MPLRVAYPAKPKRAGGNFATDRGRAIKLYLATDHALAVLTLDQDKCRCGLHLENRRPQCVAVDPLRPELLVCGTFGDGAWRS
ncbi:MAG: hypothetical protein KY475_21835 [Planctomycetes bacterium]|nr:hypothetical protein [Planctomycetota bacterium]